MENQHDKNNETNQTPEVAESSKTDVLGIISIICAFTGFQLVGFILGLIGVSKAKKEKYPSTLSRVGWILNLIVLIIVLVIIVLLFVAVPVLQRNQRDVTRKSDLMLIESEILNYRSSNNGKLPSSLNELDLNNTITGSSVLNNDFDYQVLPIGCIDNCSDYSLSVYLENGELYESNLD